ncbi:hypothetical protein C8Q80DRAFT_1265624 [Daedaleopsis nitida]|nr:hypothetical protein C8Q80DRAFT_1265624 [Daedaleopsis nitida]
MSDILDDRDPSDHVKRKKRLSELVVELKEIATDMSREELEITETTMEDMVMHMRHAINASCPVNKLPPELLSDLFHIIHEGQHDGRVELGAAFSESEKKNGSRALLALTHVCRHWRDVAFSTPWFWTHIDCTNEALMEELIPRTKTMLLTLRTRATPSQLSILLKKHGSRVQQLDLQGTHEDLGYIARDLQCATDNLKCVTVSVSESIMHYTDILPDLFKEHTLRLQGLAIVNTLNCIPGNQFPCLTHLYISIVDWLRVTPSYNRISFPDLLVLLSNTPVLESLHTSFLAATDLPAMFASPLRALVRLRYLRHLVISHSSMHFTFALLDQLALSERVRVRLHDMQFKEGNLFTELTRLPKLACIADGRVTAVELCTIHPVAHLIAENPERGGGVYIRMRRDSHRPNVHWPAHLHAMLPLERLEKLHIATHNPILLPSLLQFLPSLTELSLLLNMATTDLGVMMDCLCAMLRDNNPVLCPTLQTLGLQSSSGLLWGFFAPTIIEVAAARKQLGCPLRKVVLQFLPEMPKNKDEWEAHREICANAFAPMSSLVGSVEIVAGGSRA